ncbi:MAG: hypothetical protein ACYSUQ_03685 [Planctomycetota bacterium]
MDLSLPDLCDIGVAGDDVTWDRSLVLLRREIAGKRYSLTEAGHLGVLLALAGRGDRACQVFVTVEEMARLDDNGSAAGSIATRRDTRITDQTADPPAVDYGDTNTGINLLAALVLSGRWALARRCCERMVRSDQAAAARRQRSHTPFSSS